MTFWLTGLGPVSAVEDAVEGGTAALGGVWQPATKRLVGVWQMLQQAEDDSSRTFHPWAQACSLNVKYYFTEIGECCKQPTTACKAKIQAVKQFVLCDTAMRVVHFLVKAGICPKIVEGVNSEGWLSAGEAGREQATCGMQVVAKLRRWGKAGAGADAAQTSGVGSRVGFGLVCFLKRLQQQFSLSVHPKGSLVWLWIRCF